MSTSNRFLGPGLQGARPWIIRLLSWAVPLVLLLAYVDYWDDLFLPLLAWSLLAAGAVGIAAEAWVLRRHLQRAFSRRDYSEYAQHQSFTPRSLMSAFEGETGLTAPVLAVRLAGPGEAPGRVRGPLSDRDCLAWRLEAHLAQALLSGDEPLAQAEIVLDQAWAEGLSLREGEARVPVPGPGLIDTEPFVQRTLTWAEFQAGTYSSWRKTVTDWCALHGVKAAQIKMVVLREYRWDPSMAVLVYGQARLGAQGAVLTGNEVWEDPGSLLVTQPQLSLSAAQRQAQTWIRRRWAVAGVLAALALLLLFLNGDLGRVRRDWGLDPGAWWEALVPPPPVGPVFVNLNGADLRVQRLGEGALSWSFPPGDRRSEVELVFRDTSPDFTAEDPVRLTWRAPVDVLLSPGPQGPLFYEDPGWQLTWGPLPALESERPAGAAQGPGGRLFVRNLGDRELTLELRDAEGRRRPDGHWTFAPAESALARERGLFLTWEGEAVVFTAEHQVRVLTSEERRWEGPLSQAARWDTRLKRWVLNVDTVTEAK